MMCVLVTSAIFILIELTQNCLGYVADDIAQHVVIRSGYEFVMPGPQNSDR